MADVKFKGTISDHKHPENLIKQGDYVFCEGNVGGVHSFWGIYSSFMGSVICLDGAGSSMVCGKELYVGDIVSYWKISKRIKVDDAIVTIEDRSE